MKTNYYSVSIIIHYTGVDFKKNN